VTIRIIAAGSVVALALAAPAAAAPTHAVPGPQGEPNPRTFVTEDHACIGPLRSALAQAGLFDASFNPGAHYGSVGEETFLAEYFPGLLAACAGG
jgi:hypothetical protein